MKFSIIYILDLHESSSSGNDEIETINKTHPTLSHLNATEVLSRPLGA